ncbi:MAG: threonine--tRNA ligase [Candidatus Parvarchaeota archaeon]|nr:threonine--tRNA ligase [Candidatus Rehaiarchaeum fermentans]
MEVTFKGKKYNFSEITPRKFAEIVNIDTTKYFAAKIILPDGKPLLYDLDRPIKFDCEIEFLDFNSEEGKKIFWHSTAHLLATAIKNLYPEALPTIGPAINEGFYYDFYNLKIGDKDLEKIEKEMKRLVKENLKFERFEVSKEEAKELLSKNKFKLEILEEEANQDKVSIYKDGDFTDLCRGPHVPSTGYIKAIKLFKVAGAYWRGDPKREVLTRIYGISFPSEEELKEYLSIKEEREKRDHKLLAKEMELFFIPSEFSPGSPIFLPRGYYAYEKLMELSRELDEKYGYQLVKTPFIAKSTLWKITGHYDKYRENMFAVYPFSKLDSEDKENYEYALKPMSCPFHTLIFKYKPRSYRDLPLRIAEYGWVHRYELEGTLDGLKRSWAFQQQDAHIFCSEDQIEDEIEKILNYIEEVYSLFNIKYSYVLATRPEKRIGSDELWDKAENALKNVLNKRGNYIIKEGDGAFYGPKIDVYAYDFTNKIEYTYTLSTIQIDFNLAREFDAYYIDKDDTQKYPVVIHRAVMGAFGRFLAFLIEHLKGRLPVWMSYEQVRILEISEKVRNYSEKILEELTKNKIRATLDKRPSTLQSKIRESQLLRIPYLIIVGEEEQNNSTISIRYRDGETKKGVKLQDFINKVKEKESKKELNEKI